MDSTILLIILIDASSFSLSLFSFSIINVSAQIISSVLSSSTLLYLFNRFEFTNVNNNGLNSSDNISGEPVSSKISSNLSEIISYKPILSAILSFCIRYIGKYIICLSNKSYFAFPKAIITLIVKISLSYNVVL